MSQHSDLSFTTGDNIFNEDVMTELNEHVKSQEIHSLLNSNLEDDAYMHNGQNYEFTGEIYDEVTMPLNDVKAIPFLPLRFPALSANNILLSDEYIGPFEFEVSVLPNYNSNKNPWMYSAVLNKVYMDMNQQFPVDFKVKTRPEKPLYVRTTPQYSAQHYASEPVCRCIQHDHPADPTNTGIPEYIRQHVIRCQNKFCHYVGDSSGNERLSVVFPLSVPQAGSESIRELFQFVCKSSCPAPGMNRRLLEIIFTLEDEHGEVFGRKSLKVRICACPKRDKEKEEKEASNSGNAPARGKKRKVDQTANPGQVVTSSEDDFKVYTLNINFLGKQNMVDILNYAEKLYMAKAYQFQGRPEQEAFKKNLAEIQGAKRQLQ